MDFTDENYLHLDLLKIKPIRKKQNVGHNIIDVLTNQLRKQSQ